MDPSHDLTEGSIFKNLIKLSWPGALGRLFENLYDEVDMFWIGTLGGVLATQAQAGILFFNVANSFMQMLNSIFGPGSITVISRFWGARDYEKAAWASEQTILYKFLAGLAGTIISLFTLPYLVRFAGARTDLVVGCTYSTFDLALLYGWFIVAALPLIFVYYTINTIFRCCSDAESSMFVIATSSLVNIVIDPFFIHGFGPIPKMGIVGAALATVLAYIYVVVIGLYMLCNGLKFKISRFTFLALPYRKGDYYKYLIRIPYWKFHFEKGGIKIVFGRLFKPDLQILINYLRIGFTPTITQFVGSSSQIIFINLISNFGQSVVTAFGIGGKVAGLVNLPLLGLQQATSALVGQNLGAKKPERSEKTGWYSVLIGVCLGFVMVVVGYFFAPQIFWVFNKDPAVIAVGKSVFALSMIGNMINAAQWMLWAVFEGSGYTMWPSILGQVNNWLFNILLVYLAVKVFDQGYVWIFYIGIFSAIMSTAVNTFLVRKGSWKKAKV